MGKLTETFAKKTAFPETGHVIHYDGEVDGFGLRVTAAGQKSFVLNYRIFGKERRYTIGKYPDDYSAETARARAVQLRQGIREGKDPFAERERAAQEAVEEQARVRTVRDLTTAFMNRHVKPYRRGKTAKEYQAIIDNHIVPTLGRFRVSAVVKRDVVEMHVALKGTPYLANRVLALVSAMYEWAKTDDSAGWGVERNPAEGINRYHEEKRVRWLTEAEMRRLQKALDRYPDKRVAHLACSEKQKEYLRKEALRIANAIRLLLLTGARRSEVLSATWDQFDLVRGRWTRPAHLTKERRTEIVPISEEAITLLNSLPRDGQFVFPGRLPNTSLTDISAAWEQILNNAELDDVRLHDLRHNFASYLVSGGESLEKVGALLGHSQPATTMRYAHLADRSLRDAANRFAALTRGRKMTAARRSKVKGAHSS